VQYSRGAEGIVWVADMLRWSRETVVEDSIYITEGYSEREVDPFAVSVKVRIALIQAVSKLPPRR
jgi:hypothetical protein